MYSIATYKADRTIKICRSLKFQPLLIKYPKFQSHTYVFASVDVYLCISFVIFPCISWKCKCLSRLISRRRAGRRAHAHIICFTIYSAAPQHYKQRRHQLLTTPPYSGFREVSSCRPAHRRRRHSITFIRIIKEQKTYVTRPTTGIH